MPLLDKEQVIFKLITSDVIQSHSDPNLHA